jgi:hypothetical protein
MTDLSEVPGRAHSWIHEFAHPAVVAHLHFPAEVPHSPEQVGRALGEGAHGMELDLLFLADGSGGGDVFCGHDEVHPDSPRLADLISLILTHKGGHSTVHGDQLQFFLVLEPKTDDRRLFERIYQILSAVRDELSTAARPGTGPRGITVVLTGRHVRSCQEWLRQQYGADVNRLLIGEGIDYTGEIEDLSGARPPATFQWVALKYRKGLQGHVNALHVAEENGLVGRFNARVWGTDTDEELTQALAAGFDSVNCNPDRVARFQQLMACQRPKGRSAWLTARGSQALLVWRGMHSRNLYLALGTICPDGLRFARQVCLSTFLQGRPRALASSAALLPDGRILIVYQGTTGRPPLYVTGRFLDVARFPAFEGAQSGTTLPGPARRRRAHPAVAVAPDGRILVVYEGPARQRLRYVTGYLDAHGRLDARDYQLTEGAARRGHAPTAAFDSNGEVVVVYEGTGGHRLWYVSGSLDSDGRIRGEEHALSPGDDRRGSRPCVAFDRDGRVVVVYESADAPNVRYVSGRLEGGRIQGRAFGLAQGARRGSRPTIACDETGTAVVLYRGQDEGELRYVSGRFDARGEIVGPQRVLEIGFRPRPAPG